MLFLLVAAVLGLAGAALVVTALWPPSYLAQRRRRRLSPLERSLQQVEAAAQGDDEAARRRTLDDLATHLGEIPSPSLEVRTRALAWGQSPPDPEALARLDGAGASDAERRGARPDGRARSHAHRSLSTLRAAGHTERRRERARAGRPPDPGRADRARTRSRSRPRSRSSPRRAGPPALPRRSAVATG